MNFKLPKPEDYPGDDYKYQLAEAYANLYTSTLTLLCSIEGVKNVADEVDSEFIKEKLQGILNQYQS